MHRIFNAAPLALLCLPLALRAADDTSTMSVAQFGSGNTLSVEQNEAGHTSLNVRQDGASSAYVLQEFLAGARASLLQSGSGHVANIQQSASSDVTAEIARQAGGGGFGKIVQRQAQSVAASLDQNGSALESLMVQQALGASAVQASQGGEALRLQLSQHDGTLIGFSLAQSGREALTTLDQSGSQLTTVAAQSGSWNELRLAQSGQALSLNAVQAGSGSDYASRNLARVSQEGIGLRASVQQSGAGQLASVRQR